jgi:hypothetical protein
MSKTYIIIDGLDECDIVERKMILSLFTSLAAKDIASGRLKCLFISQDENDIRKLLKTSSILKLTGAHNKSDIEAYTTYWLEKIKKKFAEISDVTLNYIKASVCNQCDGTISLARF